MTEYFIRSNFSSWNDTEDLDEIFYIDGTTIRSSEQYSIDLMNGEYASISYMGGKTFYLPKGEYFFNYNDAVRAAMKAIEDEVLRLMDKKASYRSRLVG